MTSPIKEINHKDRDHALLSASAAKRWLACTPSARLEDTFPDSDTEFSKEGTRAHELSEKYLRNWVEDKPLLKWSKEEIVIIEELKPYIEYIQETYLEAKKDHPGAVILFEQRLDYSNIAEEGFGTGDVVMVYGSTIHVIDLKFGKGVAVSAEDNPQLRLYAIGAVNAFDAIFDFDTVITTIHQPRLDHVTSETMAVADLIKWGDEEVAPKAKEAWDGTGKYVTGSHCRFCKASAVCRARAEENLALTRMEFRSADILSDEELAEVITQVDKLNTWANAVQEYVLKRAIEGIRFPGFKLVEGRSIRQYKDSDKVASTLVTNGFEEAILYERKLLGLTAMEKLVGKKKFTELVGDLIFKPPGKPTLVAESDPRQEFNSAASDFANVELPNE